MCALCDGPLHEIDLRVCQFSKGDIRQVMLDPLESLRSNLAVVHLLRSHEMSLFNLNREACHFRSELDSLTIILSVNIVYFCQTVKFFTVI